MADNKDNKQKIQELMSKVKKRFGNESINILDSKRNLDLPNVPTRIMSLDLAIGIGGIPKGRIIELYGDSSAGKCLAYETYTNLLVEEEFYQFLVKEGYIQYGKES